MARCLLLNASYEPHSIISDRDAVCMYLDDVIEVVVYSGAVMRSPSITVLVPSVARLKRYVPMPDRMRSVMLTTRAVLARDGWSCGYCGRDITSENGTMDHVIPREKGGKHRWENVAAACRPCNAKKGSKLLSDLNWKLRHKPFRPQGIGARILALHPEPAWEQFLGSKPVHEACDNVAS